MIKIFYDTETTGVDYKKHSMIQLAGLIEIDDVVVDEFNYDIKPHPKALIEPEALKVNKKTVEEIMLYTDMKLVLPVFKKKLSRYIDRFDKDDNAFLVGFNNASFDDKFLRKFFELCGDDFINSWFYGNTIDVSVLASQYLLNRRSKMPTFKLKRVAMELGIEVDNNETHDALYDTQLTRQIYRIVTGIDEEI